MVSDSEEEKSPLINREDRSFDSILSQIGEIGPYQLMVCLVCLLGGSNCAFHYSVIQYLIDKPTDFWCADNYQLEAVSKNLDSEETCLLYGNNCTKWEFSQDDLSLQSNIVTEWHMYCSSDTLFGFIESSYLVFCGIGIIVNGMISDKIGRRKMVILCTFFEMITGIAVGLSPNVVWFVIFRYANGLVTGAAYAIGYILAVEMVGPKWRAMMSVLSAIYFEIFRIIGASLALVLQHWKQLQLAGSLVDLPVVILLYFLVSESPRWLMSCGRNEEAIAILEKFAKWNKKKMPDLRQVEPLLSEELNATELDTIEDIEKNHNSPTKGKKRGRIFDLIKGKKLRIRTLELYYSWFVLLMVYWELALTTTEYTSSSVKPEVILIIYSLVTAVVVAPFQLPVLNTIGRRYTHVSMLCISIVGLLFAAFTTSWPKTIAGTIAVIGTTYVYYTLYVRSAELFPTGQNMK